GLLLDYSKNRITDTTLLLLTELARSRGLAQAIAGLFEGNAISSTEGRPALHTALRHQGDERLCVWGENVVAKVQAALAKMRAFVDRLHGPHSKITDCVHIGIGGSDLGPRLLFHALKAYRIHPIQCHFVSHADGAFIRKLLAGLNPETTLVIVASK